MDKKDYNNDFEFGYGIALQKEVNQRHPLSISRHFIDFG